MSVCVSGEFIALIVDYDSTIDAVVCWFKLDNHDVADDLLILCLLLVLLLLLM